MSRILVTGASGFIGRSLVPALRSAGHEVRTTGRGVTSSEPNHVAVADVTDEHAWRTALAEIEIVIHLAGIAHVTQNLSEDVYDEVNHRGTAALTRAATEVSHLIFMSSIRAQTGPTATTVLTEADPARPTDAYGRSKLAAEHVIERSGIPYTVVRPVLVYGPELKGNLRALQRLARFPLPFGRFTNRRSLLSLDNLVDVILHLVARGPMRTTFVLADREPITLVELIAMLGRRPFNVPEALVAPLVRLFGGKAMWERLGGELVVDPGRILATGWIPRVSTREGLARLGARHD